MRKTKEPKGITLIALVITIIVLLILAGVALATLNGNTSIIDNANYAVEEYSRTSNADDVIINKVEGMFAKYMGESSNVGDDDDDDDTPPAPTVDANGYATEPYTVVADATNNIQIVIPEGFAPAILKGSNSTTSLPGQDGSVKEKMAASQWSSITAAQINAGVVVVNEAGEEFVWVPIPSSSDFARTAWTIGGIQQTLAETSTSNAYWDDKTTTEYINMVSSVNTNKGFYISRYEASVPDYFDGYYYYEEDFVAVAHSVRGQDSILNMPQTEAIAASSANSIANTHLMYGIEWDSVLNWLIGNATIGSSTVGQTKTMQSSDITDSLSWGNYLDAEGDAGVSNPYTANTGTNEYWKANNIYDLAGNASEWTQEHYGVWSSYYTVRGGSRDSEGDYDHGNRPVADRWNADEENVYASFLLGFRFSFYL